MDYLAWELTIPIYPPPPSFTRDTGRYVASHQSYASPCLRYGSNLMSLYIASTSCLQEWDLVSTYPNAFRALVPVFTKYTDAAFPGDDPVDTTSRVALRCEFSRDKDEHDLVCAHDCYKLSLFMRALVISPHGTSSRPGFTHTHRPLERGQKSWCFFQPLRILQATMLSVFISLQVRGRSILRRGGALKAGFGRSESAGSSESVRGHVRSLRSISQGEHVQPPLSPLVWRSFSHCTTVLRPEIFA